MTHNIVTHDPYPISDRTELDPAAEFDRHLLAMMDAMAEDVAPGVRAHVVDPGGPWIVLRSVAATTPPIPGAVGTWLDTLPRDRKVVVPAVTSRRLAEMLVRRGFECRTWYDKHTGTFDRGAMIREADPVAVAAGTIGDLVSELRTRVPWWRALAMRLGIIR